MSESIINSADALKCWFALSGVSAPLQTCIGPLPSSKASVVRWTSDQADELIQTLSPHPGSYRISVMLEPLEARIWSNNKQIWAGLIAANRFRICPPSGLGYWSRMSGCDIVNLFIPLDLVDQLSFQRGDLKSLELAANMFTSDRHVLDFVHKILDANLLAGPLANQFCDYLVSSLVIYLLEHYTKPLRQTEVSSLSGVRLRKVLAHIAESKTEDVSIAELAGLCGISESHFSRAFRLAVGLPPYQYMMKQRLIRACDALMSANNRIVDIAYECGFHNASHFSRSFTAYFGMPPASFRRQRRSASQ
ncbi:MAG: AraC family transcriptional regulator [Undibacterium sp.]|nr:AraC family transcriptional regulator [Undibacterium sp.]